MKTRTLFLSAIALTLVGSTLLEQEQTIASTLSSQQVNTLLIAQAPSNKLTGGPWSGEWKGNDGSVFNFTMQLSADFNNRVTGSIKWKMLAGSNSSNRLKIGLTAIEYVSGTYDPETRSVELQGQSADDPNGVISLDVYKISFDSSMQSLTGKTKNHGNWKGEMTGVTDGRSEVVKGSFNVDANSSQGISFTNASNESLIYSFQARGTWTYNPSQGLHSAVGHPSYLNASSNYKLPGVPEGSLIVRRLNSIGAERYEYAGDRVSLTLSPGEKIWFVLNDSYYGGNNYIDNQGQVTVSYESVAKKDEVVKPIGNLIQTDGGTNISSSELPISENPALFKKHERNTRYTVPAKPKSAYTSEDFLFGPANPVTQGENAVNHSGACEKDICLFDVRQGDVGDCYFLASLAALAHFRPQVIRDMIKDNNDDTYTVFFFVLTDESSKTLDPVFQKIGIRVDSKLPLTSENTSIYAKYTINPDGYAPSGSNVFSKISDQVFGRKFTDDEAGIGLWAALSEKAYAILKTKYPEKEKLGKSGYSTIDSGKVFESLGAITGTFPLVRKRGEEKGENKFFSSFPSFEEVKTDLLSGKVLLAGSTEGKDSDRPTNSGIRGGHEYVVLAIDSDNSLVLYNPHGIPENNKARKGEDSYGILRISYENFKQEFEQVFVLDKTE
jgi:hypothetical protein